MARAPALRLLLPFAAGIAFADRFEPSPLYGMAVLVAALVLGAIVLARRRAPMRGAVLRVLEAVAGLGLGVVALALPLSQPSPGIGAAAVPLRLLEAPRSSTHGCRVPVRVGREPAGRALLLGPPELCAGLPGALGLARLRVLPSRPPSNPGARDTERPRRRRGIRALARVGSGELAVTADRGGPAAWIERLRRRLAQVADPERDPAESGSDDPSPARSRGLLRALVTGERSRLDPDTRASFERAGTAHLLAISGLHVGWVFALTRFGVSWWARRLPLRRVLRRADAIGLAAGMGAALAYATLAGLGVPALRALAMAWLGATAVLGGRPAAIWNGLALAALAVLALEPASLFEPGSWLSFAAVVGILLWRPAGSALARLCGCTLGAGLATAPLVAGLGLPLPAGTLLANALAVPWFGSVVVPLGLLAAGLGAAAGAPIPVLDPLAGASAEVGIRAVEALESPDLLADLSAPTALAAAIVLAGGAFALRGAVQGRPGLVGLGAGLALTASLLPGSGERAGAAPVSLLFLDVGHGDAVLVRSQGVAWLVDAGPRSRGFDAGRSVVLPALRAEGVLRLDRLVLTHADRDHVGGVGSVLERVPVGELWMSRETWRDPGVAAIRRAAARRQIPVRWIERGARARLGQAHVRVLWPPLQTTRTGETDAPGLDRNAASVVLELETAGTCALLPGDVPADVERRLEARRCALLKLAHHGSGSSSHADLLARVDPEVAIVSAGARPRAPLPHPAVEARLRARGATLWHTHASGALRVDLGVNGPVVRPFLVEPRPRPAP